MMVILDPPDLGPIDGRVGLASRVGVWGGGNIVRSIEMKYL